MGKSPEYKVIEPYEMAGPAGIEPTTPGLKARCFRRHFGSILAELRARNTILHVVSYLNIVAILSLRPDSSTIVYQARNLPDFGRLKN